MASCATCPTTTFPWASCATRRGIWYARRYSNGVARPSTFARGVNFGKGHLLSIGDASDLGPNCRVVGNVTIGDHVGMSFDIVILSMTREKKRMDVPLSEAGAGPDKPVVIEDGVGILARVMILAGVRVRHDTLIGGGAVVSKEVPAGAVVAGNPARVVSWRAEPDPDYDPKTMTPLSEKLQRKWDDAHATDG